LAYSGEGALVYMEQYLHETVLVLSDMNMPGMIGLELLEKIKDKIKEPPLVVMMITAFGDAYNYNQQWIWMQMTFLPNRLF